VTDNLAERCGHLAGRWEERLVERFVTLPPHQAIAETVAALREAAERLRRLQTIVDAQAEDEGLWFVLGTAPEAYLQQELRRLHAAIEEPS
jgi:hypothetical protein